MPALRHRHHPSRGSRVAPASRPTSAARSRTSTGSTARAGTTGCVRPPRTTSRRARPIASRAFRWCRSRIAFATAAFRSAGTPSPFRSTSGRNRMPSTGTAGRRRGASSARADDSLTLEYDHAADAWPFPYRARQDFGLTDDALEVDADDREPRTGNDAGRARLPSLFPAHRAMPARGRGRRDVGDRCRGDAHRADRRRSAPGRRRGAAGRRGGPGQCVHRLAAAGDDHVAGTAARSLSSTPIRRSGFSSSIRRPARTTSAPSR